LQQAQIIICEHSFSIWSKVGMFIFFSVVFYDFATFANNRIFFNRFFESAYVHKPTDHVEYSIEKALYQNSLQSASILFTASRIAVTTTPIAITAGGVIMIKLSQSSFFLIA
jgi:hypothetical protein